MSTFIFPLEPVTVDTGSLATAAKQDTGNTSLSSIDTKLSSQATATKQDTGNTTLSTIAGRVTRLSPVDQIDTTPLLDTSSTNIPASAGDPVTIVASSAAQIYKIVSVEDIGSYIGLYTGIALSEVLLAVLPLGGGEIEVSIAAGTRISLRAMENSAISSGKIAINFLG